MDRKLISHRIGSILDDISRLSNALYALDTTDIQRYPDNYETLSIDAALRAERIACRLRHLIYSSTTIRKGDYLKFRRCNARHHCQLRGQGAGGDAALFAAKAQTAAKR